MKISLNSLQWMCREFGCVDNLVPEGVDVLIEKIGAQLGEIEDVTYIGDRYAQAVIVKVITCEDHPNADKLHVCTIDDGGKTPDVNRLENGFIEVVCGAPNVHAGMLAVWLPPASTVPESVGKEPFLLEARELRGVVSNGMLASPKELALGDSHEGILEITDDVAPGTSFGEQYDLNNDVLIEIENKMFTHRPDCFGFLGVARELAGIQGLAFKSPEWYDPHVKLSPAGSTILPLVVRNEIPSLVPRFTAIAMSDVQVGPSPIWLQVLLAKYGVRSINNIVDYTNYFMLETGQPIHAYDYDKVKALSGAEGAIIEIRNPRDNERIKLLNGKELDPRQEAIMIATDKQLIGVGGVMGGADTEVDETTKNIIIEVATFDMYSIRRTAMAHGLFTDAVTRFNKGQSPLQNKAVLAKIVDEIMQYAHGKVASDLVDENQLEGRQWVHPPVPVTTQFINDRLGFSLSAEDMRAILGNVEIDAAMNGDSLIITAPFWRTDIETREDVVEEVGRLYGFDKLPLQLPVKSIAPASKNRVFELKNRLRENLVKSGANEVLTYSFVHGNLLDKVGQDKAQAFKLGNALSPDLQYYRLSLTPSLLDKVHMNIKAGYDQFALFELGAAHGAAEVDEDGLPKGLGRLSFVIAAAEKVAAGGAPYYAARRYVDELLTGIGFTSALTFVPVADFDAGEHILFKQLQAPFDAARSAIITYDGGKPLGIIGEYTKNVHRQLKLPAFTSGFELFLGPLGHTGLRPYSQLSRFPKVHQDITFKIPGNVSNGVINELLHGMVAEFEKRQYVTSMQVASIYRGDDAAFKNVSYGIDVISHDKTLTESEVSGLLDEIATAAKEKLGAERV